jgi:catalase
MRQSHVPLAELDRTNRILFGFFLILAIVFGTLLIPQAWSQDVQPSGREMVDAFHSAFGEHHARAVHAKGTIVTGSFMPSGEGSKYTTAPHLQRSVGKLTVIARFSDFTGIPDISDTDPIGSPKGFGVRFLLPDGQVTDLVNHSFNGFPASNAADLGTLLRAIGSAHASPPDGAPLDQFLATHPAAKSFLTTHKPSPTSWATTPYFGVNAFKFTNSRGQSRYIRYRFVPLAGESYISKEQEKSLSPNFLSEELATRLKKGPVKFTMEAQIANDSDDFRDPAKPWPEDREVVNLGVLTFTAIVPGEQASKNLQFEPASVTIGIETADPMLVVRKTAYPVSASERQ